MLGIDTSALVAFELKGHAEHPRMAALLQAERDDGEAFAVTAQVLAEFVHVATDSRRFAKPLPMSVALERVDWWLGSDSTVLLRPTLSALTQFTDWMSVHHLGRKRGLDTLLAATFYAEGVSRILTLNAADFTVFDVLLRGVVPCPMTTLAASRSLSGPAGPSPAA